MEYCLFVQNAVIFLICGVFWNTVNQIAHLLEQLLSYRTPWAHFQMKPGGFTPVATVRNTEHCAAAWP